MSPPGLFEEVLEAHGGAAAWDAVGEVEADLRSGGFALASKLVAGPFRRYTAGVSFDRPRTVIEPYPEPGSRGVFEGDRVLIESEGGQVLAERSDPRRLFPGVRRRIRWDRLDALYFAGYALWNYLTTPRLLTLPGIDLREEGRVLHAVFPEAIPTHSREQAFHVDGRGLIVRHDYTAEVFGGWARAKHASSEHQTFDGLVFPTRRRVTPRGARFPTLVWIDVDGVRVRRR
jgi:hypothetical protein